MTAALLACVVLTGCSGGDDDIAESAEQVADCTDLKNLAILVWADGAGLIPARDSLARWTAENPELAGFDDVRTEGGAIDVARLWEERKTDPDAWNDLQQYYANAGLPWLQDTDLEDIVPVDANPTDGGDDPLGWRACPRGRD